MPGCCSTLSFSRAIALHLILTRYILLNLFLSMLAAVQAPVILMSQNRQGVKDRLDATHDYEVNLKAELEILSLHEKLTNCAR